MPKRPLYIASQVKRVAVGIHLVWLLTIVVSVGLNHLYSQREMEQTAMTEARSIFRRDATMRKWFSDFGGAYLPVTAKIPPNPHLEEVPYRDVFRPDGSQLTLVNPSYLMRLLNDGSGDADSPRIRMTSTRPLRPENSPDLWERAALARAEGGAQEILEFTSIDGQPFLRYLHAAVTTKHCLKCHAQQGYKVGDLRGGLAIALPIAKLLAAHDTTMRRIYLWHLLIYLAGATLLLWGQRFVSRRIAERDLAVAALADNEKKFRTVADFAYAWEYWIDPAGRMVHISPSVQKVTGYPAERFLADPELIKGIMVGDGAELLCHHLDDAARDRDHALDVRIRTATGEIRWIHHTCRPVYDQDGVYQGRRVSNFDITEVKTAKLRNDELIVELREAMEKVKTLSGFLPICASCKKIRDDRGYWNQLESYISKHSEAVFSHGICPECAPRIYPELFPDRAEGPGPENEPGAAAAEQEAPAPEMSPRR